MAVTEIGFQGRYDSEDLWEWFKGAAEGFGREWYSNWMATWQWICTKYRAREWQGEEDDSKISRHSSADTGATDDQREWQDSRISRHSSADIGVMDEDQRQQAQREQNQLEISKASQQKEQVVWDLENQLDKWVNKCALCYVQQQMGQQVDVQHTLDQCGNALQKEVVQEIRGLERIRFEPYASCYACGVPQKICMQWKEQANGQGRFGRASGGRCQYQGVVRTSIAAIMIAGPDKVVDEQVYSWMKAKGIEQGKQMMIKWFGQRVIWGEVEGSILIQVFYKLAVGLEQWRRDSRGKGSGRGVAEW